MKRSTFLAFIPALVVAPFIIPKAKNDRIPLTFDVLRKMGAEIIDHFPGTPSGNQDAVFKGDYTRITLLRNITSRHAWALDWEHNMGHHVFQYVDELEPLLKSIDLYKGHSLQP